ncbi:MAG: hypothetical protein H0V56_09540 [Chthoniobacterales bacterium]|nr:hypothetical protein [Chthoniobacterales bacterium]
MRGNPMNSLGMILGRVAISIRILVLAVIFLFPLLQSATSLAQLPPPVPTRPDFQDRPFGPLPPPTPVPTPKRVEEPSRPIHRGWIIGGIAVGLLALAALIYGAVRVWRSSNLFDRQYRFPVGPTAAVRLGGNKCGGLMATVSFASAAKRGPPAQASEAKNA